ncbi:MAG: dephospho-CoA kinase [Chitinophagaceae bacterium]|nr:dephospho-CoA kinase [Chitinophagaceae bacterium]MCA6453678.1 dephospho-CoA kinase [Chitinophagaceae bacterium]MCA6455937.1 dephospho-CoA kinase [Chitinophagaceae bacterium]MCA6458558.1 dephospho-CoA kinase [Chitinophagaceae bacterium]MCA6465026.1 dephospho-CoA kinase [Chitinophagaceae bacterium]
MALRIGLTGGIGSGKSTVSGIFKVLGIPVFDADTAAKEVMQTNPALRQAIMDTFGEAVYTDGQLNRKQLAALVFSDPFQLETLNALVHPYTIAAAEEWAALQTTPYTVKEAALFFEAGSAIGFDYMIGVYAPQHLRIKRVMDRDQVSREEVLSRMKRQIQEEIKMRLCDFVVLNDDQHLLIPQVLKLHEQFLNETGNTYHE